MCYIDDVLCTHLNTILFCSVLNKPKLKNKCRLNRKFCLGKSFDDMKELTFICNFVII